MTYLLMVMLYIFIYILNVWSCSDQVFSAYHLRCLNHYIINKHKKASIRDSAAFIWEKVQIWHGILKALTVMRLSQKNCCRKLDDENNKVSFKILGFVWH